MGQPRWPPAVLGKPRLCGSLRGCAPGKLHSLGRPATSSQALEQGWEGLPAEDPGSIGACAWHLVTSPARPARLLLKPERPSVGHRPRGWLLCADGGPLAAGGQVCRPRALEGNGCTHLCTIKKPRFLTLRVGVSTLSTVVALHPATWDQTHEFSEPRFTGPIAHDAPSPACVGHPSELGKRCPGRAAAAVSPCCCPGARTDPALSRKMLRGLVGSSLLRGGSVNTEQTEITEEEP